MTVTSYRFFVFLFIGAAVYYTAPKRMQWVILLCLSVVYYFLAATPYTILFLILSTVTAYTAGILMECRYFRGNKAAAKWITCITAAAVLINIFVWFLLKGNAFWMLGTRLLHESFPIFLQLGALKIVPALGMGYYTAQIIGYILDCYWGICTPQRNILKLFLFVGFFPQLTVGPISKYSELECLYRDHSFNYINIAHGSQRILWGLFKKLVISDRLAIIVNGIWTDTLFYNGFWPWIVVFVYPLEIYTDFSGCMDIILGAAELFDIRLPENFRNPFFSRTCQEFWQRWHITLGTWARDHVYYPVLKSRMMVRLGKWSKQHFSKRIAKLIPWAAGMWILWFVMGFWHGSSKHIIGVSAYFWTILVLSEICSPGLKKITGLLKVDTESFSWHFFQSVRTYIIYSIGVVFFTADRLTEAFEHVKVLIRTFSHPAWNPWIFFDGSIRSLGVSYRDLNVILLSLAALLGVDVLREKYGYARTWLDRQILPFRWMLYVVLLFAVLIFGMYGPGYNASEFIYGQF